jgi:hypothetical protein
VIHNVRNVKIRHLNAQNVLVLESIFPFVIAKKDFMRIKMKFPINVQVIFKKVIFFNKIKNLKVQIFLYFK